jgi:uncharacterized protein (DUF305 family)
MTDTVEVEAPEQEEPRRVFIPMPMLVFGVCLLFLAGAVGYWWAERDPSPNATDVGFYDDMTTHHFQAIAMAHRYLAHGDDPDPVMAGYASEIDFGQSGDIRVMQDSLARWRKTGDPDVAMDWMDMPIPQFEMPGLATDAQMDELNTASGTDLDDLFSQLMIEHHAGGVAMAEAAVEGAGLGEVKRLAENMVTVQNREIQELNRRRVDIGLPAYEPTAGAEHEHLAEG